MRSQSQIQHQLKQVAFRHLQKRLRALFKQRPETCLHNYTAVLNADGHSVQLCGLMRSDGVPRNVPCDERIPGCTEMARECSLWEPLQTKDEVKGAFKELLDSGAPAISQEYPDIAALMWVLEESKAPEIVAVDSGPPELPEESQSLSWWRRWMHKLGGGG